MRSVLLLVVFVLSGFIFSGCTNIFDRNNKSGLQILTNDVKASVFLDQQYLDKTPYINKELKPGQYLLRIEPEDSTLIPYETTINLRKGLLTVVTWKPGPTPELSGGVIYELEKLPNKQQVELSVVSIPDGAVISVDEDEKNFSPLLQTDVDPGSHSVAISLPSFETQEHTVNVVEGHRLNILVKLAKNPAEPIAAPTANPPLADALATPSATTLGVATSSATTKVLNPTTQSSIPAVLNAPISGGKVTIQSTNFFQDGQEVLRVRDQIGIGGKEIGFAKVGSIYPYLGETTQGWHKINFENKTGWVSGQYTKLEK